MISLRLPRSSLLAVGIGLAWNTAACREDTGEAEDTDGGDADTGDTDDAAADAVWTEHACAMAIPSGLSASDFTCGTLTVPHDWDNPGTATVTMEVAVLHAATSPAAPDPFVFFGGGPGAWNLEGYLPSQAPKLLAPIREQRDVVFFDKRGNGLSTPSLFCPEYDTRFVESFTTPQDAAADGAAQVLGYQECKARLDAEGVDVAHFNSYQVGHDVAALMAALGYDEYNIYGISYGAREAQTHLRDHPQGVRSMILDSPVMPDLPFGATFASDFDRAVNVLAQECAEAPMCSESYPDLRATLLEAIDLLNTTPYVSSVPDADGVMVDVHITGDRFAVGIQQALYRADLIPLLPTAIGGVASGQNGLLDAFAPELLTTGGFDWGYYAAAVCSEEYPFEPAEDLEAGLEGLDPVLVRPVYETNAKIQIGMCEAWMVPARPEIETQPVISDTPTLILTGQFDPVTPPSNGDKAAANLSAGTNVVFNGMAHGVLRSDEAAPGELSCAQQLVVAFLDDPNAPVDGTCAEALPDIIR